MNVLCCPGFRQQSRAGRAYFKVVQYTGKALPGTEKSISRTFYANIRWLRRPGPWPGAKLWRWTAIDTMKLMAWTRLCTSWRSLSTSIFGLWSLTDSDLSSTDGSGRGITYPACPGQWPTRPDGQAPGPSARNRARAALQQHRLWLGHEPRAIRVNRSWLFEKS